VKKFVRNIFSPYISTLVLVLEKILLIQQGYLEMILVRPIIETNRSLMKISQGYIYEISSENSPILFHGKEPLIFFMNILSRNIYFYSSSFI